MKFRKLKKFDFVIYSDLEETYFVKHKGKLTEYIKWEYDNGLYVVSGINKNKGSYKSLRQCLKTKNDKYSSLRIWINIGICHRCGCKLTESNFKFDDSNLDSYFEYDYFYCNSCKEEQVRDFEKFMLELDKKS